jgi:hexosaminidase
VIRFLTITVGESNGYSTTRQSDGQCRWPVPLSNCFKRDYNRLFARDMIKRKGDMKTKLITLLVLTSLLSTAVSAGQTEQGAGAASEHNLMPVPAAIQFQPGRLAITPAFKVALKGHKDDRLLSAINRAARRLEGRAGLAFDRAIAEPTSDAALVIACQGPGQTIPSLDEDESYSLEVSSSQATLSAPTVVGVIRGLETFLQLLDADRDSYFIPAVTVNDRPRFRWRGLLIDVARHFQPVEVLKRNLDAMASVKLNVLHWHLTEDQGFRVESRRFPKLHLLGSDGLFYTQDQIRDVIGYARDRGIRVIPEFDMPGHATSWLVGHPELGSAPGPYKIERKAGIFDPAFDPTREELYKFLDTFFGEMAALFPDAYMHIGGDENEGKQWDSNPRIQAFKKEKGFKDNHTLQAYFNLRVNQILKKHRKRMVGWDEILHPDLPKDVVVQSWRGPGALAESAKKGYDGILSAGYYIDLIFPASDHYKADPVPQSSDLNQEQISHILGGEATMWSEWVSPETIDSRIWPRTAAIAERLWSQPNVIDVADMYRRLGVVSLQLEELGLTHKKNAGVLLRRLARTSDVGPLETLVSVIEPVKEYRRGQMRPATMLNPLTGLIDAARPDSEAARRFAAMVDAMLSDAPRFNAHQESIRKTLTEWRDARPALDVIIARSPFLREAEPLAKDLSDIGLAGLEAISYLSSNVTPTAEWRAAQLARLAEAARPKAALEFAVITSVKQLVIAAAELPQLKTTSAAEWKERVKTLAVEKPPSPDK